MDSISKYLDSMAVNPRDPQTDAAKSSRVGFDDRGPSGSSASASEQKRRELVQDVVRHHKQSIEASGLITETSSENEKLIANMLHESILHGPGKNEVFGLPAPVGQSSVIDGFGMSALTSGPPLRDAGSRCHGFGSDFSYLLKHASHSLLSSSLAAEEEEELVEQDPEVLHDNLAKQRLANKRDYSSKGKKTPSPAKPKATQSKPKSKKQLLAEQMRREREVALEIEKIKVASAKKSSLPSNEVASSTTSNGVEPLVGMSSLAPSSQCCVETPAHATCTSPGPRQEETAPGRSVTMATIQAKRKELKKAEEDVPTPELSRKELRKMKKKQRREVRKPVPSASTAGNHDDSQTADTASPMAPGQGVAACSATTELTSVERPSPFYPARAEESSVELSTSLTASVCSGESLVSPYAVPAWSSPAVFESGLSSSTLLGNTDVSPITVAVSQASSAASTQCVCADSRTSLGSSTRRECRCTVSPAVRISDGTRTSTDDRCPSRGRAAAAAGTASGGWTPFNLTNLTESPPVAGSERHSSCHLMLSAAGTDCRDASPSRLRLTSTPVFMRPSSSSPFQDIFLDTSSRPASATSSCTECKTDPVTPCADPLSQGDPLLCLGAQVLVRQSASLESCHSSNSEHTDDHCAASVSCAPSLAESRTSSPCETISQAAVPAGERPSVLLRKAAVPFTIPSNQEQFQRDLPPRFLSHHHQRTQHDPAPVGAGHASPYNSSEESISRGEAISMTTTSSAGSGPRGSRASNPIVIRRHQRKRRKAKKASTAVGNYDDDEDDEAEDTDDQQYYSSIGTAMETHSSAVQYSEDSGFNSDHLRRKAVGSQWNSQRKAVGSQWNSQRPSPHGCIGKSGCSTASTSALDSLDTVVSSSSSSVTGLHGLPATQRGSDLDLTDTIDDILSQSFSSEGSISFTPSPEFSTLGSLSPSSLSTQQRPAPQQQQQQAPICVVQRPKSAVGSVPLPTASQCRQMMSASSHPAVAASQSSVPSGMASSSSSSSTSSRRSSATVATRPQTCGAAVEPSTHLVCSQDESKPSSGASPLVDFGCSIFRPYSATVAMPTASSTTGLAAEAGASSGAKSSMPAPSSAEVSPCVAPTLEVTDGNRKNFTATLHFNHLLAGMVQRVGVVSNHILALETRLKGMAATSSTAEPAAAAASAESEARMTTELQAVSNELERARALRNNLGVHTQRLQTSLAVAASSLGLSSREALSLAWKDHLAQGAQDPRSARQSAVASLATSRAGTPLLPQSHVVQPQSAVDSVPCSSLPQSVSQSLIQSVPPSQQHQSAAAAAGQPPSSQLFSSVVSAGCKQSLVPLATSQSSGRSNATTAATAALASADISHTQPASAAMQAVHSTARPTAVDDGAAAATALVPLPRQPPSCRPPPGFSSPAASSAAMFAMATNVAQPAPVAAQLTSHASPFPSSGPSSNAWVALPPGLGTDLVWSTSHQGLWESPKRGTVMAASSAEDLAEEVDLPGTSKWSNLKSLWLGNDSLPVRASTAPPGVPAAAAVAAATDSNGNNDDRSDAVVKMKTPGSSLSATAMPFVSFSRNDSDCDGNSSCSSHLPNDEDGDEAVLVSPWVIISNLPMQMTEGSLRVLCQRHGTIRKFFFDHQLANALVLFQTSAVAQESCKNLDGTVLGNKEHGGGGGQVTLQASLASNAVVAAWIEQNSTHSAANTVAADNRPPLHPLAVRQAPRHPTSSGAVAGGHVYNMPYPTLPSDATSADGMPGHDAVMMSSHASRHCGGSTGGDDYADGHFSMATLGDMYGDYPYAEPGYMGFPSPPPALLANPMPIYTAEHIRHALQPPPATMPTDRQHQQRHHHRQQQRLRPSAVQHPSAAGKSGRSKSPDSGRREAQHTPRRASQAAGAKNGRSPLLASTAAEHAPTPAKDSSRNPATAKVGCSGSDAAAASAPGASGKRARKWAKKQAAKASSSKTAVVVVVARA